MSFVKAFDEAMKEKYELVLVSVSRQHLGAAAAAATAWLRSLLAPPVGTCPVECAAQA